MHSGGAIELLELATRFDLNDLVTYCSLALEKVIEVDNVCSLLGAADRYAVPSLREACIQFMCGHYEGVVKTAAYQDLKESNPTLGMEVLERALSKLKPGS